MFTLILNKVMAAHMSSIVQNKVPRDILSAIDRKFQVPVQF